ncbi:hypothetical protein [Streptoalloteichus hindustanus]|uniref:Uncharacterized protein n=1 Tax=Streptoalloteichus hindustanus TaxID=2017 RepID=A0A1M5P7W4_STRHI|nr:hypothetical protein [Streptoalloteichus hindustanus]SHG97904.1 hypothetical protein SAMN05444320_117104 [Streptoalloteichus hindustanus]
MNVPPRWHLMSFYRIDDRGQRRLRHQRAIDDDDYWYIAPCGPQEYALALACEYFLDEQVPSGQRWVITVDVLTGERGQVTGRLCSMQVTVPPEDDLAPTEIRPRHHFV